MLTPFFRDDPFFFMDSLERRMNQAAAGPRGRRVDTGRGLWLRDEGAALVLTAELPGFTAQDFEISLDADVLTVRGERRVPTAEGYELVRSERGKLRFVERVALPAHVDADAVEAKLECGVLTITLPKAAAPKARTIPVRHVSGATAQA